jgi:hypothetical protein
MLTLTYLCPPVSGRKAKADLKGAIQWVRRRCEKEIDYVWWTEFTVAHSIHFHVLLSCLPNSDDIRDFSLYWLARTDQGDGRYCDLRKRRELSVRESILRVNNHRKTWERIREIDGAKRYVMKDACKPYQKEVPVWFQDIGRFWGASRNVRQNREEPVILQCTEDELREILVQNKRSAGTWDVLPRHLWHVTKEMVDFLK